MIPLSPLLTRAFGKDSWSSSYPHGISHHVASRWDSSSTGPGHHLLSSEGCRDPIRGHKNWQKARLGRNGRGGKFSCGSSSWPARTSQNEVFSWKMVLQLLDCCWKIWCPILNFGLAGLFAVYSLRRGGATFSLLLHGSMDKLLLRGRWSSTSTARIYIQDTIATVSQLNLAPLQKLHAKLATDALHSSWTSGQAREETMERGSQLLSGVCCWHQPCLLLPSGLLGCQKYVWIFSAKLGISCQKTLVIEGVGCQLPTAYLDAKCITETNPGWSAKRMGAEIHVPVM